MDLATIQQQLRAMKQKVRAARKDAENESPMLRQFKSSVRRLLRKVRQLSPKQAKVKAD